MKGKKVKTVASQKREEIEKIKFGKINYLLLLFGIVAIVIGYLTLSKGSITTAPILLVLGYCILIPFGLIIREKKKNKVL